MPDAIPRPLAASDATDGDSDETTAVGLGPGLIVARKFALLRCIAEGGAGVVYEAQDLYVQRRVALKLLHPEFARNPDIGRRFLREARATAAVAHPNVVAVLEVGRRRDGSYYIAQELLEGKTLREHAHEQGRLEVEHALDLLIPLANALSAAHRKGIIHRDVKPDNVVLVRGAGDELIPKLVDFGVAKVPAKRLATLAGTQVGTPSYMSPEQVRGDAAVDGRSDIWSLGLVLLELVAGRMAFDAPSHPLVYLQILERSAATIAPIAAELPAELRSIVLKATEADPEARYATMDRFREALARIRNPSAGRGRFSSSPEERGFDAGHWLDVDAFSDDDGPTFTGRGGGKSRVAGSIGPPPDLLHAGAPASDVTAGADPDDPGEQARAATRALGMNALERADSLAQGALARGVSGTVRAHMCLVRAISQLWLGSYVECGKYAQLAMLDFEKGTTGWAVALGHAASACAQSGRSEDLPKLYDQLEALSPEARSTTAAHIAACRLAIALLRTGERGRAEALFASAVTASAAEGETLLRAWVEVVLGERAIQSGDPSTLLRHAEAAVEHFTFEGDVRNASLQRHNIASACMELGGYARAQELLRGVLVVAEPMGLNLVAGTKANLGVALARLGRLDEAQSAATEALGLCAAQGNRRFEAVGLLYLGMIHGLRGQAQRAAVAAREAAELSAGSPPVRAFALALLAGALLHQDEAQAAFGPAVEAVELVDALGGIEEGEALVRLVHHEALAAVGKADEARSALVKARARILERAGRILDPAWRRTFLESVPEHARTLELAASWIDGRGAPRVAGTRTPFTLERLAAGSAKLSQ